MREGGLLVRQQGGLQMKKLHFTAALAALGLFAASQTSLAGSAPLQTPDGSVIPVKMGGGGGGGMHSGGAAMGHAGPSFGGRVGGHIYGGRTLGGHVYGGHTYAFNRFHHRRGFFGGPYIGFWDYGPYYDGGSCYWNCRESGYGPAYCRANAWEFCG
jgi:hypothetical protein